jgi:hypothetical protein
MSERYLKIALRRPSKGMTPYTLSYDTVEGAFKCSCPAWKFSKKRDETGGRRACKHLEDLQSALVAAQVHGEVGKQDVWHGDDLVIFAAPKGEEELEQWRACVFQLQAKSNQSADLLLASGKDLDHLAERFGLARASHEPDISLRQRTMRVFLGHP